MRHLGIFRGTIARGLLLLAFCLCFFSASARAQTVPPPVIFDTDMDFDDTAALAYLAAAHKQGLIDLRAVTITTAGVGYPKAALRHARCLLSRAGLGSIPVGLGYEPGVNLPSPLLRLAVELVLDTVFLGCLQSTVPALETAPEMLARVMDETQGRAVLIATGPLTNVAAGLAKFDEWSQQPRPLRRALIMGGAIAVPGSLPFTRGYDGSQELNIWADPASAQRAFARLGSAVSLIPLDATNFVPITAPYALRLRLSARTPEARIVAAIATHPLATVGVLQKSAYWWDPLAAVEAIQGDVVSYVSGRIGVVQSGASSGRLVGANSGAPIRYAVAADKARFEQLFIDTLNAR